MLSAPWFLLLKGLVSGPQTTRRAIWESLKIIDCWLPSPDLLISLLLSMTNDLGDSEAQQSLGTSVLVCVSQIYLITKDSPEGLFIRNLGGAGNLLTPPKGIHRISRCGL